MLLYTQQYYVCQWPSGTHKKAKKLVFLLLWSCKNESVILRELSPSHSSLKRHCCLRFLSIENSPASGEGTGAPTITLMHECILRAIHYHSTRHMCKGSKVIGLSVCSYSRPSTQNYQILRSAHLS